MGTTGVGHGMLRCVTSRSARSLVAAAGDLVAGIRCAGCGAPGSSLCARCRVALRPSTRTCWPDPCPAELVTPTPVTPWCAASYADTVRRVLLAFKEQGRDALAGPLSSLLSAAVRPAVADAPRDTWLLVPMVSRRAAVRARGYDPVLVLTRLAARRLRRDGHDVRVVRALRHRRRVVDQSGLDVEQRRRNLDQALRSAVSAWPAGSRVLVVDDVITTGATLVAAVAALRAAGADVQHAAVVAATPRELPKRSAAGYGSGHVNE